MPRRIVQNALSERFQVQQMRMHGVLLSEIKRKVPVQKLQTSKLSNKRNCNGQVTLKTDNLALGNLPLPDYANLKIIEILLNTNVKL